MDKNMLLSNDFYSFTENKFIYHPSVIGLRKLQQLWKLDEELKLMDLGNKFVSS